MYYTAKSMYKTLERIQDYIRFRKYPFELQSAMISNKMHPKDYSIVELKKDIITLQKFRNSNTEIWCRGFHKIKIEESLSYCANSFVSSLRSVLFDINNSNYSYILTIY